MRKYSRFLTISAAVVFAFAAVGCSKKTVSEPTTQESTETITEAQTEPTTTTEGETETPVVLEDRYHMLQGTVTKAADDGSVFTLQADDGVSYDLHVVQIRDVEVDLSPDSQIAIAYIGFRRRRRTISSSACRWTTSVSGTRRAPTWCAPRGNRCRTPVSSTATCWSWSVSIGRSTATSSSSPSTASSPASACSCCPGRCCCRPIRPLRPSLSVTTSRP